MELNKDYLNELFTYDSGNIYWKSKSHPNSCIKLGTMAGSLNSDGYRVVKISGITWGVHRVIWVMHYGDFEDKLVEHKNRDKLDNRIENLRLSDYKENGYNRGKNKSNTTNFKGVCFHKQAKKFQASIKINYKQIHLGLYATAEEASVAYENAAQKLHGEFYYKAA